jgi:ABC-type sugar transport system ATPase subunit
VTVETVDFGLVDVGLVEIAGAQAGDAVTIGVRPEHCIIGDPSADGAPVAVRLVEELGDETVLEAITGSGQILVVKARPSLRARTGDTLSLHLDPRKLHVFHRAESPFLAAQRTISAKRAEK